ncbi:LPXTG cell wall anchor domain-containing protein [Microbacterium allomyrinae]|uniref:LPXTG cell wall anchor domain-containing protein n=1 Tax=Microbacterium allomyrinae TaxID=2830666 RepID=A0A9X1LYI2_9MICO|nr:LPXTG cell wall anchor domain-containing protein [Microbacterium allomyrinae]MCC2034083.1 LPXTG cell wall anchor domain-containing protein [Microbacterium allomyrinae]
MTTRTRRAIAATIAAASLAIAGGVAVAPAAVAAPAGSDLDYFSYAYPGLREGSVFETVTFERFEYLLGSEGTYAFLIGGPADETTNTAIAHIDAVAQTYGVEKIYVLDPRVDGDEVDIRTSSIATLQNQWTGAVTDFLNKDTTPAFGGEPGDDPYLFVYDKAHTAGGSEDRIVASLGGAVSPSSVATEEGAVAYRAQVSGVFDAVADGGSADVDTQSHFTFYKNEINRKHSATYKNAALYGGDIIEESDGADWTLKQITYPELVQLLESDGDHIILFGGTWCHNTRAVVKDVNRAASAAGVKTVYQFDLRLDGNSSDAWHIRDTASPLAYLYGDVVAKFFPNLRTQYIVAAGGGQKVDYYPGGDTTIAVASAKKLQVPYLIEYNKADAAAPIVQDWIQDKGDGTFTEYMTEWWWVAGLPGERNVNRYTTPEAWAAEQTKQWQFADEAIAKIDSFFAAAAVPSVGPSPSPSVEPSPSPSVDPSPSPSSSPSVEPVLTDAAVSVTGDLHPGGAIVVSGTGLPASTPNVTVEIRSTPKTLGTVSTTAAGAFRLETTIPTSIASGAHTVVVLIDGQVVASQAVTVAAAPTAAAASNSLAVTGGSGIPFAIVGGALVLLIAGAILVVARRRRATV